VVNGPEVEGETVDSLARRFEEGKSLLVSRGVPRDLLEERAMITPACGLDGLREEQADRVYSLTAELSELLRGDGS
jgi:hypothetical protein